MNLSDLIIFELANNHQGDVEHGKKIISEMARISVKYSLNAAVKFQYRQLDTFIHPSFRHDKEAKHISRFLDTELSADQFKELVDFAKLKGMITMCTPFDESSVDLIEQHNIDIIKIASCSADDWPLISRIAKSNKPVITSTGGLELWQIDNVVSYLTHRLSTVGVLHCVGVYPTPHELENLNFIERLTKRYKEVTIGYSGHESPDDTSVAILALAKGATIFERHVGVPTDTIKLNAYSMNPKQVEAWIKAIQTAKTILGSDEKFISESEKASLLSLKRGVFANKTITKGSYISADDVFFAMPCNPDQVTSGVFGKVRARFIASKDYVTNEAIYEEYQSDTYHRVRSIIHQAKGLLEELNIVLSDKTSIELNHHYGIENFDRFGCMIVNLVNREYCKKIIVVFPGQHHPEQKHMKKEETFHILSGEVTLTLNGLAHNMVKGNIVTIERGVLHSFYSESGAVIEEISTTHFVNDSYYTDPLIAEQDPMQRKTIVDKL